MTVNTIEVEDDSEHVILKKVIFHLFVMHVIDKFHHTMQFHPALRWLPKNGYIPVGIQLMYMKFDTHMQKHVGLRCPEVSS